MRTKLFALASMLFAASLLTGSVAQAAVPTKQYLRLSAVAVFTYTVDYGDHPDSVFNGTFASSGGVSIRAIVVYDGRGVYVPSGGMIVESSFSVSQQMTQWNGRGAPRLQVACDRPERRSTFRLSNGSVSVSRAGFVVSPGNAVVAAPACNATESMVHHGLPSGPSFTLPAPARSRFTRRAPFSITCQDSYEHDFEGGLGRGVDAHAFRGFVFFHARLTPISKTALPAAKRTLRGLIGKEASNPSLDGDAADCL